MFPVLATLLLACTGASAEAPESPPTTEDAATAEAPEELGDIRWRRDYDHALIEASETGKPVLLLFTELPGCSTVKGFGNGPLSEPAIVAAANEHFVPVAVLNNHGGPDFRVLTLWNEPKWNNPVVRFIDGDGHEVAPRHADDYSTEGLARAMSAVLEDAPKPLVELAGS